MNAEVELDQHGHAGRQLSALLSAALAASQAAAQVAADRARRQTQAATQQARQSERTTAQLTRDQQLQRQQLEQASLREAQAEQRRLERQGRAEEAVRHRQWGIKPASQWLHDNPLSAAAAWASADVHRDDDPIAARHAEQWESIFKKENIDLADVRANAPAAVSAAEQQQLDPARSTGSGTEPAELAGEFVAAEVAGGAVLASAVDVAHAAELGQQPEHWPERDALLVGAAGRAGSAPHYGDEATTLEARLDELNAEAGADGPHATQWTAYAARLPLHLCRGLVHQSAGTDHRTPPRRRRRRHAHLVPALVGTPRGDSPAGGSAASVELCRDADGEAPARWFWQHCDPMLAVLMDAKVGPMADCKPDHHRKYANG